MGLGPRGLLCQQIITPGLQGYLGSFVHVQYKTCSQPKLEGRPSNLLPDAIAFLPSPFVYRNSMDEYVSTRVEVDVVFIHRSGDLH